MIKVNKLTNILTKCTKGNMYNNNTRFDLTRILKPQKVITVKPVLPSEEKKFRIYFRTNRLFYY